jgi:hypothetical protein
MKPRRWVSLAVLCLSASTLHAQERRISVVVEYLAGANLYISAGTNENISPDDTLFVYEDSTEVYLGAFVVISSSQERSVVTFAGDPFPVTRGKVLQIEFTGAHAVVLQTAAPERRRRDVSSRVPEVHGRFSVDMNMLQSTTQGREVGVEPIDRYFTTPSARLRLAIVHLPGDIRFRTNARFSARYSAGSVVEPTQSLRVYQATLDKSFEKVPVQVQAGRFYSPFETYSGYWDGLLVHLGSGGFGGGVAVGFQPERSDEAPTAELPKYTVFLDYRYRGKSIAYRTDVSFHEVRPRSGFPSQMFAGWSQRLRVGRFQLSNDLQVDRDPATDTWRIAQLQVRSSIPLARGLDLNARYSRRQPSVLTPLGNLISSRREQVSGGLSFWARGASIRADVTANRFEGGDFTYTYSSSFSVARTPFMGVGLNGSGSYWKQDGASALFVTGGVSRTFGRVVSRASYQRYRSEFGSNTLLTHAVDLSLTVPFSRRVSAVIRGRTQRGENLTNNNLYVSLWTSF